MEQMTQKVADAESSLKSLEEQICPVEDMVSAREHVEGLSNPPSQLSHNLKRELPPFENILF